MLEPTNKKLGLNEPAFAIQAGGKIYLTLGVLEYDPSQTSDPTKLAVISDIEAMIEAGPQLPAVQLTQGSGATFANTNANTQPPNPNDPIP